MRRAPARNWFVAPLITAAMALACSAERAEPEAPTAEAAPTPTPTALLLGQRHTVDHRQHFDSGRRPTIRVESTTLDGWTLTWGPSPLPTEVEARAAGVLLRPTGTPPDGDAALVLRLGSAVVARWPVHWGPAPAALPALAEAVGHRKGGRIDAALAALDARLPTLSGVAAAHGWMELGRARRLKNDASGTRAAWQRAARVAREAGADDLAAAAERSTIWLALWTQDLPAMQAAIAAAGAADTDPVGALRLDYYRALLATELGDYIGARRRLEQTAATARRLGADDVVRLVDEARATVLAALGRYRAALEMDPELIADPSLSAMNRGWLMMQAMDAGVVPADYAAVARRFEQAQAGFAEQGDQALAAVNGVNRAWLALRLGQLAEARAGLDAVAAAAAEGYAGLFAGLVEAELRAAEGRLPEALEAFEATEAAAEASPAGADVGWRAALGHARALRRLNRTADALAAYRRALARLDRHGQGTGVREERASFFADRAPLIDESIDALLTAGETEAAFAVADRARARVVRALEGGLRIGRLTPEQQARWAAHVQAFTTAGAELEALRARDKTAWRAEDKARLASDRAAALSRRTRAFDDAWRFLQAAAPVAVERPVDPRALQTRLGSAGALLLVRRRGAQLDTFWVRAGGLRHARVTDPLAGVDLSGVRRLHLVADEAALAQQIAEHPIDGRPLATMIALTRLPYAAALSAERAAPTGPPVVVADPRGDLPAAVAEGRAIAKRLAVSPIEGAAATPAAVQSALDGAGVFHFAGHGDLRGAEPWDAHLRLAGDGRLTLEDVLLLRPKAGLVVLSGCRTGARLSLAAHEVIGLPEAFLAAGSRAVLVTRRDVGDDEARLFVQRFYAAGGAHDPAQALMRASAAALADGDPSWLAFELWGS